MNEYLCESLLNSTRMTDRLWNRIQSMQASLDVSKQAEYSLGKQVERLKGEIEILKEKLK